MTPTSEGEKTYSITKEHCQSMISGVCNGCGGELTPIETVDNSNAPTFWAHCASCSKYHWGTSVEVFRIAEKMFNEGYRHYSYNVVAHPEGIRDTIEYHAYYKSSQIAGTCGLVQDVLKHSTLTEQNAKLSAELHELKVKRLHEGGHSLGVEVENQKLRDALRMFVYYGKIHTVTGVYPSGELSHAGLIVWSESLLEEKQK